MKVNVILFDADGVIQTTRSNFKTRLKAFAGEHEKDADQFISDIFAVERPCLAGETDFAEELQALLLRWQIKSSVDDVLSVWHAIDPIFEITELIQKFRLAGNLCCLATNQQQHRAAYMKTTLGYDSLFDHQFYSNEMGVVKPDTAYFQYILTALQLPASETLFIDDNEANVEAARTLGIHALQFNCNAHTEPGSALLSLLKSFNIQ